MSNTYQVYQGDAARVEFNLVHSDGSAWDLGAASAVTIVVLPDVESSTVAPSPATPAATGVCTIVTGAKGIVRYTFTAEQTADYGMFQLFFMITWKDGSISTWPDLDDMWLWIKRRGYT